jgi:D-alanyl-D-alanine carboxypeptidase
MATLPQLADPLPRLFAELGIDPEVLRTRQLPVYPEARQLAPIGLGTDGRDKFLLPSAARAWSRMRDHAATDGIELLLISAFRSYAYQTALIRGKVERGRTIDEILRVNAPPGCSEHHTGRAVDIGVSGCAPLEAAFDATSAFQWLTTHAGSHGFSLSFPKDNPQGYIYEPWHWCHHEAAKV